MGSDAVAQQRLHSARSGHSIAHSNSLLAPGLEGGNITNVREVFRQLDTTLFATMAPALWHYGNALLKTKLE